MKISFTYPPNITDVVKVFPAARAQGVIFTYGDTIFNPGRVCIPAPLLEHERIHSLRQGTDAIGIEKWWNNYLTSKDFRFEEEVLAHKEEYRCYMESSRKEQRRALRFISRRLASPLYGSLTSERKARSILLEIHDD